MRVPASIIAEIAHETNRIYARALGDLSIPKWNDAPEWQRRSILHGVEFHIANPFAGPEASHESWMREKLEDGWTYGEKKDPAAKTHPCLVSYDQLDAEQRRKDVLFLSVVHALQYPERQYMYATYFDVPQDTIPDPVTDIEVDA